MEQLFAVDREGREEVGVSGVFFEVRVRASFSASHSLEGYDGPCSRLHGHNFEVEACVRGDSLGRDGMLVDFALLKDGLRKLCGELDHRHLDDLEFFSSRAPTAENIALFFFEGLSKEFPGLEWVAVSETPGSTAVCRRAEGDRS